MDIQIYIPSYNRPNAPLIRRLKEACLPFTIVLDHEDDIEAYKPMRDNLTDIMFIEPARVGNVTSKERKAIRTKIQQKQLKLCTRK